MNKENVDKLMNSNNPYARGTEFSPIVRIYPKVPRNTTCSSTGKKFKHCCGQNGQDFCDKAKDSLKEHLMKLVNEHEKEKQAEKTKE